MSHKQYVRGGFTAISALVSTVLQAQPIQQLDTMTLQANFQSSSLDEPLFQEVIGAAAVINLDEKATRSHLSNADLFDLQPTVYAQSAGNEGIKLSIRGSGLNRGSGAHGSGTSIYMDDIPFTGQGGTPYELLEPLWVSRVQVLPSGQGLSKGSLALGGVVNYLSQNGINRPGLRLNQEIGAYQYHKTALSYGQKQDNFDYFLSVMHSESDGFQNHAATQSRGVMANVGYTTNEEVKNRFYLRYRQTQHQTPGRLTQSQIQHDPQQANVNNLNYNSYRNQPGSLWLAHTTDWKILDESELKFGLAYHDYPMDLQEGVYETDVSYQDINGFLEYSGRSQWGGIPSHYRLGMRAAHTLPSSTVTERLRFDKDGYAKDSTTRRYYHRGGDYSLYTQHHWTLTDRWSFEHNLNLAYTQRDTQVTWPKQQPKLNKENWAVLPRLALSYEAQPNWLIFASISRTMEPAHAWSMLWSSPYYFSADYHISAGRQRQAISLKPQFSNNVEIGQRIATERSDLSMSYYYSKIKNELLQVELQPSPVQIVAEYNASPTIHQGIELAWQYPLWQTQKWGEVMLDQAYTLNNFQYQRDQKWKKNELAGIPKHYYQGQLRYQHPQGWYGALSTQYAAKMPIDYANTHDSDAYWIWNIHLGYQPGHGRYQPWLEFKNITDRHYSATITPGFNDFGHDTPRATPGQGFSVYAGLNLAWF